MLEFQESIRSYDVNMTDTLFNEHDRTKLLMEVSDLATRAFSIGLFAFASLLFVMALNLN